MFHPQNPEPLMNPNTCYTSRFPEKMNTCLDVAAGGRLLAKANVFQFQVLGNDISHGFSRRVVGGFLQRDPEMVYWENPLRTMEKTFLLKGPKHGMHVDAQESKCMFDIPLKPILYLRYSCKSNWMFRLNALHAPVGSCVSSISLAHPHPTHDSTSSSLL